MVSHPDSLNAAPILPTSVFMQCCQILRRMAQQTGDAATVVFWETGSAGVGDRCAILMTPAFSVAMLGQLAETGDGYHTTFLFQPETIAQLLHRLPPCPPEVSQGRSLDDMILLLGPNAPEQHSQFMNELLGVVLPYRSSNQTTIPDWATLTCPLEEERSPLAYPNVCQPVELALQHQVEQERLLNQVITQIRQSLELPVILETAVSQVCQFLKVDRLIIYQLEAVDPPAVPVAAAEGDRPQPIAYIAFDSYVTYEARSSEDILSLRHIPSEYCSAQIPYLRDRYQQGFPLAVADVAIAYADEPAMLTFLKAAQVQSKLAAPIMVQDQFWGLLVAHQCHYQRQWKDREISFLQHIAEHLAIAIRQASLYAQLQEQKEILEQGVIERTRDLRHAMIAAQTANQAKSEFLSAMSHELRTPLTSIIGMSTTLMRWLSEDLTPRQRKHLQTIHDSGKHLLELINDILDLSQVESGHLMLRKTQCSLSSIAQQTLRIIEPQAKPNQIRLELDLRVRNTDTIVADPLRLQQILINLLSNAVKFTPEGGMVVLSVFQDDRIATLQVKDTGIGIAEEQLPLLFQKFQQLDTSYSRRYNGTGLGLALTKNLVELHGGNISVESTVGVGSVFTVRLPIQPMGEGKIGAGRERSPAQPERPTEQGRLIVLIENHEETANLVCDMLNAAGYQVVWIVEGAQAIAQIDILRPSAVILDLDVPDTNGYDVIRQLRKNPSTKRLKIMAIGHGNPQDNTQTHLDIGADDYLTKPLYSEQILPKITAMVPI